MRSGLTILVSAADRRRLEAIVADRLLVDRTRPPGKAPVADERVAHLVRLTHEPPPHEATHWTARAMAKAVGLGVATVQKISKAHGLTPHRWRTFKLAHVQAVQGSGLRREAP